MKDKIKHFLNASLIGVCIVCLVAFGALAVYLNLQNEQAVTQLGNIYVQHKQPYFKAFRRHKRAMPYPDDDLCPEHSSNVRKQQGGISEVDDLLRSQPKL